MRTIASLPAIDPALRLGAVHLAVSDLPRSVDFYTRVLGLALISQGAEEAILGSGERPLVQLTRLAAATAAPPRGAGLFHLALLHPSRIGLADTLIRLGSSRWPSSGASDHAVSEAIYLDDPDGLGIEICADRPREQWPVDPATGAIAMTTPVPLDLDGLLATMQGEPSAQIEPGTVIGHVHLRVADVERSVAFYRELGLELQAGLPTIAFLAAGGYHHHIGVNSWYSRGAPPVPPTSPGLRLFELEVSDGAALDAVTEHLQRGRVVGWHRNGEHITLRDPDQQALVLTRAVGSTLTR